MNENHVYPNRFKVITGDHYLAACSCGWFGSSEECSRDAEGDVYCPACNENGFYDDAEASLSDQGIYNVLTTKLNQTQNELLEERKQLQKLMKLFTSLPYRSGDTFDEATCDAIKGLGYESADPTRSDWTMAPGYVGQIPADHDYVDVYLCNGTLRQNQLATDIDWNLKGDPQTVLAYCLTDKQPTFDGNPISFRTAFSLVGQMDSWAVEFHKIINDRSEYPDVYDEQGNPIEALVNLYAAFLKAYVQLDTRYDIPGGDGKPSSERKKLSGLMKSLSDAEQSMRKVVNPR
jgi:hypothetical protein